MKILLLLPILFYLLLILVNIDLLQTVQIINFFGVKELNAQILLYNSIFIVFYAIIVFFTYDGLNIFLRYKLKKQEEEIIRLKSTLYNWQEDILKKISKEIEKWNKENKKDNIALIKEITKKSDEKIVKLIKSNDEKLENYKNSNQNVLLQHWKETDKLLSKINLIDKWVLDKIKNSLK